jgi:hypothetical protein
LAQAKWSFGLELKERLLDKFAMWNIKLRIPATNMFAQATLTELQVSQGTPLRHKTAINFVQSPAV